MNTLVKKIIILAAVALIAYLTFTNLQSTQYLQKGNKSCDNGLDYCFGQCRDYQTCELLQQDHDIKMAESFNGQDTCKPPLHLCGDGMCHSGWCPY
ncbi:hypothetical protein ABPG74_000732 [Tetrahymena malaccensis]